MHFQQIFQIESSKHKFNLNHNYIGTGQPNGMSNNRDRGSVGNTGAKTSATNTSGSLSETNQSHPEVLRSSSSSAALVNANNTENSNKYNHYQMQHNNQKSTGTSSITSDSITGIAKT